MSTLSSYRYRLTCTPLRPSFPSSCGYSRSSRRLGTSSVQKKFSDSCISCTPGSQNRFSTSMLRMLTSPSPCSLSPSQNTPYTAHPDFSLFHHACEYAFLNRLFFRITGNIRLSSSASRRSLGSLGSTVGSG